MVVVLVVDALLLWQKASRVKDEGERNWDQEDVGDVVVVDDEEGVGFAIVEDRIVETGPSFLRIPNRWRCSCRKWMMMLKMKRNP